MDKRKGSSGARRKAACLAIVAGGSVWGMHVVAAPVLEEIVVEAQMKTETILETPIAITAISGDQFQQQANFNFQDLSRTTPGLSFSGGVTPNIHLRGIGTITRAAASLRTNIYQDGALIDQPRTVLDAQFDIERFEILRGPQGTLYGKSSPTGTINVRTRNPSLDHVDGYVSASVAEHSSYNTQFGVSLPLIEDKLAIRLAGVYDESGATDQHNVTLNRDALNRSEGGRLVVLWQPSDDFSARLSYNYREKKEDAWFTVDGAGYRFDQDVVLSDTADLNRSRDQLTVLELEKSFNEHLYIAAVTGYQRQLYRNLQDPDGTPFPQNTQFTNIDLEPTWQQDLRLASEDNDFWDWQMGLFYLRAKTSTSVEDSQRILLLPPAPIVGQTDANLVAKLGREDYAAYTHNTFKFSDALNLIVGLRYQRTREHSNQPTTISVNGNALATFDSIAPEAQEDEDDAVTGTLKLQYFFNPDLVGYVSYDRAYRSGVSNLNVSGNLPANFARIDPETANSIEFGIKGNFWDRRGRFSVAVYDQVYKDFQQDVVNIITWHPTLARPMNLASLVASAKEAETRGVEFEVGALLLEQWDVNLAVSFNDAQFNDFKDNPCLPAPGQTLSPTMPYVTCDLSGERMPQAPRWSGVLSSNFWLPLPAGLEWYFNTLIRANSNQVDELTRETLSGYATVDFFTGLRAGSAGAWEVGLWVKNAFDRRVVNSVYKRWSDALPDGTPIQDFDMVTANFPRQVGLTASYRFD